VLSYNKGAGDDTRKLFEGTFERFLKRRPVQIGRLPTVKCRQGHLQERGAVLKAIDNARQSLYCDACGEKLATPRIDSIGMPAEKDADFIRAAEQTADRRTTYEVAVAWLKGFRRDRGKDRRKPSCFISYAWGDPKYERWVEQLADYLQNADVDVILDRWHNPPGASVGRFVERIEASDFVCAVGTPGYRRKDLTKKKDPVVQAELRLIKSKLMKRDTIHDRVIPVLYQGTAENAFPPMFIDSVFLDFRTETEFFVHLFELVLTIHRIPFGNKVARQYRNNLLSELPHDAIIGAASKRLPVN